MQEKNNLAQQKQSVPMNINDFVEMTVFLCLICFSIYAKMQGFVDKCVCFVSVCFMLKFKMATKNARKTIFEKSPVDSADTLGLKNFVEITLRCTISEIIVFTQKFKIAFRIAGNRLLRKVASRLCRYPMGQKFC